MIDDSLHIYILFWLISPAVISLGALSWIFILASPFLLYQKSKKKLSKEFNENLILSLISLTICIFWIYTLYLTIPKLFDVIIDILFLPKNINKSTAWLIILLITISPFTTLLLKKFFKFKLKPSVERWFKIGRLYIVIATLMMLFSPLTQNDSCRYEMAVSGQWLPSELGCR